MKILKIKCFITISSIVVSVLLATACSGNITAPEAYKGRLNISARQLDDTGTIKIRGEWEFYWEKLLEPKDFKSEKLPGITGYFQVPASWNSYSVEGRRLKNFGYASYRLIINTGYDGRIGIIIYPPGTAFKLWINGDLIGTYNSVGKVIENSIPVNKPVIHYWESAKDEPVELLIQLSNYSYYQGGLYEKIVIGTEERINKFREKNIAFDLMIFGALIIIGFYHLGFFLLRKNDKSLFCFSIFSIVMGIRILVVNETFLLEIIPGIDWELFIKINFLTVAIGTPVCVIFFHYFYNEIMNKLIIRGISISGIIFGMIVIIFPGRIHSQFLIYFHIVIIFSGLTVLYYLIKAARLKLDVVYFSIAGFIIIFAAAINDVLYANSITQVYELSSFGLVIFIFMQSINLSIRFSHTFDRVEELSNNLTQLNIEQSDALHKLEKMDAVKEQLLKQYEQSKYQNMQERMNPHFLYNAIHTIHALLRKNPKKADLAVITLAELFKYLTEKSFKSMVNFNDEWEFVINYLNFEKIRFPDILSFEINKYGEMEDILIPSLSIQPLVENAIKHGLRKKSGKGVLKIKAVRAGNEINIEVIDDGAGFKSKNPYTRSLGNIRNRLLYYYFDIELNIIDLDGSGTKASIYINLDSKTGNHLDN